jgi:hypothetical protein
LEGRKIGRMEGRQEGRKEGRKEGTTFDFRRHLDERRQLDGFWEEKEGGTGRRNKK